MKPTKYRLLRETEIVMEGDEYCIPVGGNQDWWMCVASVGSTVVEVHEMSPSIKLFKVYRRKMKEESNSTAPKPLHGTCSSCFCYENGRCWYHERVKQPDATCYSWIPQDAAKQRIIETLKGKG